MSTEAEARAKIAEQRRTHSLAGHHCSAYVLGPEADTTRSNDDGEPSGTAGPPILDAIRGVRVEIGEQQAQLSDVLVVVSRWFGGTLLGTGGLVQAYGEAARTALAAAGTITRELRHRLQLSVDYAVVGRLEDQLLRYGSVEVDYSGEQPSLTVSIAGQAIADAKQTILAATGGDISIADLEPTWVDLG